MKELWILFLNKYLILFVLLSDSVLALIFCKVWMLLSTVQLLTILFKSKKEKGEAIGTRISRRVMDHQIIHSGNTVSFANVHVPEFG